MTFSKNYSYILLSVLLLPISAIWPYFWFGGVRAIAWAITSVYWPFWTVLLFSFVAAFFVFVLLKNISPWGRLIYTVSVIAITINSAVIAMQEHSHSMLVAIFFLCALQITVSEWMRTILRRPYYRSCRNWWEGYPKSLPGLKGIAYGAKHTEESPQVVEVTFSNMGDDGCFIFTKSKPITFKPVYLEVILENDHKFKSRVEVMLFTKDKHGCGLRFKEHVTNQDWQKEMSDYLNQLRRLGYVTY